MKASDVAKPGLFERAVTHWLMRPTVVSAVETLSPHFRFIDFAGEALKDAAWSPGQKIQIKLDGGLITRTYTPIHWDRNRGATRILAYAHGTGPGSDWALSTSKGDERAVFGPRRSLDLEGLSPSVVVFGDETSFGLAAALSQSSANARRIHCVFEVSSSAESRPILESLGLGSVSVIERQPDEVHLAEVEEIVSRGVNESSDFVLSGKASSIQRLHRALKQRGVPSKCIRTKVYWAPGKLGLD